MHSDTPKTKSPDYLFRNPHSYCFRMGVPEALRDIVGRRELRYSLRTGRLSEARRRSRPGLSTIGYEIRGGGQPGRPALRRASTTEGMWGTPI